MLWAFGVVNKSKIGMSENIAGWYAYGGSVHRQGATLMWDQWDVAAVPIWANKDVLNAPPWATLKAAYFTGDIQTGVGTVVFIGP